MLKIAFLPFIKLKKNQYNSSRNLINKIGIDNLNINQMSIIKAYGQNNLLINLFNCFSFFLVPLRLI